MANRKEKNLLDEITYLTRLIGQHKNGHTSTNRKWECVPPKSPYQLSHKVTHPYFSTSRTVVVHPSKVINTSAKQSNMTLATKHQEKKNYSVYINPKFKSASLPKQPVSSNAISSASSLCTKQSNVHINPHFSPMKSTKSSKVLNNHNPCIESDKQVTVQKVNLKVTPSTSPDEKLKVHLNPKFCKLIPDDSPHTQLRTLMTNKVHVNPKLVEKVLKEKNETENYSGKDTVSSLNNAVKFPKAKPYEVVYAPKYAGDNTYAKPPQLNSGIGISNTQNSWRKSEFLTLGKRKLVRVDQKVKLGCETKHKSRNKTPGSSLSFTRNRCPSVRSPSLAVKKAKVITSKYKLVKNQMAVHPASKLSTNKYKIDRRSPATKQSHHAYNKSTENYRLPLMQGSKKSCLVRNSLRKGSHTLPSAVSSSGNMVWRRTWSLKAKEFKTTNTKLYRIGNYPALKKKSDNSKSNITFNKSLVRIGGVLYKSSRNKLTISQGRGLPSTNVNLSSSVPLKKKGKTVAKGQVLCIRGQKFVMDSKGKTLKRVSSSDSLVNGYQNVPSVYSFRRVDIGGVTFVKKSSNLLMRTDTHKARSLLSYAKQKSIATLMKKLKKNNQPCIIFRKFGKCFRMEKGTCPCVHDRKHVAVCKRFLQGKCFADNCLLSHDVVPEKMPTCKYFLEGCCNRQNCPYLHVKLNSKAEICIKFLQGYCENGKKCKKRHVCLCPEFEKTGKCIKGKHCPYPHKTVRPKKNMLRKSSVMVQSSKSPPSSRKCSIQARQGTGQPCASHKNEHTRYYLASQELVGDVSKEISSHSERISSRELNDVCSISSKSEVSSSCGSDPVVTSEDLKLSSSRRILSRDKIGSLPSFIPL